MRHHLDDISIAKIQLEKAISLYFEKSVGSLVCAETLSGAAEELLGSLLIEQGKANILTELKDTVPGDHNLLRNGFKHLKLNREDEDDYYEQDHELLIWVENMIRRAIVNYSRLTSSETDLMSKFIAIVQNEAQKVA